jgi:DNA repair exonuclease SbcCD nuclease subunit
MSVKVLCTGDLHLGRSSARAAGDAEPAAVSTTAAWHRVVQTAIAQQVSLVCLTGDVADESNRFWEAIGPLEQGIGQLAEHDITTLAVAGNHDFEVLPRLADQLAPEHFRLLGRGGQWERATVELRGQRVAVAGWSFPDRYVATSPITADAIEPFTDGPLLALLHGDLDDSKSPYAPLDRAVMRQAPVDGWLLGHIHAPGEAHAHQEPVMLYPGSPQALDPGEPGVHGPWILELSSRGIDHLWQVPMSGVRYERVGIDLTGVDEASELESHLLAQLDQTARAMIQESGTALKHLCLRVALKGKTALAPQLRSLVGNLGDLARPIDDTQLTIERVEIEATPPIDLHAHGRRDDPPGALARLILALEQSEPTAEAQALIERTRRELQATASKRDYLPLRDTNGPTVDEPTARHYLHREAHQLLNELLSQAG